MKMLILLLLTISLSAQSSYFRSEAKVISDRFGVPVDKVLRDIGYFDGMSREYFSMSLRQYAENLDRATYSNDYERITKTRGVPNHRELVSNVLILCYDEHKSRFQDSPYCTIELRYTLKNEYFFDNSSKELLLHRAYIIYR